SDGNGSHASTLKSPSYTKSVSWQHYQRRRKSPGDESETLTRRNDAIFGNHVWQTFAQYFPPGLEKPSV
ncbi:hypothetical protein ACE41V_14615, partial [Shigella sonnei]